MSFPKTACTCRYLSGAGRRCRQEPRPDPASKECGPCPRSSEVPSLLGAMPPGLLVALSAPGGPGQAVAATACVEMPSSVAWQKGPSDSDMVHRLPKLTISPGAAGRHPKTSWVLGHPPWGTVCTP